MSSKPLVLITGATGHIGFRTLVEVLKTGQYRARVSTRKLSQADKVRRATSVQPYLEDIEFIEVPDITARGAFDEAVKGAAFVLHLASPIPDESIEGHVKEVYLDPAVRGTLEMLESAAKSETVKRVVITSSVVILAPKPGSEVITPNDLAPVPDPDDVPQDPWLAYRASKVLAYDASQKWMAARKPLFDLLYILPAYVQGRNELVTHKDDVRNGSNDVLVDLVLGNKATKPRFCGLVWVDDVARLEAAALDLSKGKSGDRFIAAYPESVQWNEVTPTVKRLFANEVEAGILPLGGDQPSISVVYDTSESTKTFGGTFSGLETMVRSLVGQYVELAKGA